MPASLPDNGRSRLPRPRRGSDAAPASGRHWSLSFCPQLCEISGCRRGQQPDQVLARTRKKGEAAILPASPTAALFDCLQGVILLLAPAATAIIVQRQGRGAERRAVHLDHVLAE